MPEDINDLKERLKELQRQKAEREERERLLAEIKQLEEEGTLKQKIRTAAKSIRSKLQEKGRKFKESGDNLKRSDKKASETVGSWNPAIAEMADQSQFGTKKEYTSAEWKPKIARMK